MRIKITVQGGVVQEVGTSAPAIVQIVDLDADETSTFKTVTQLVEFTVAGHELDALLNHEVMADPLTALFEPASQTA